MKGRAQLTHALIDVDLAHKPKMMALEDEFGPLVRLFFMDLICAMSRATMARIPKGCARSLARRVGLVDQFELIITYCLKNGMLIEEEDQLSNARVIADQEQWFERQLKLRQDAERKRAQTPPKPSTEVPRKFHGDSMEDSRKKHGMLDSDTDTDNEDLDLEELSASPTPQLRLATSDPPSASADPPKPLSDLDQWAEDQLEPESDELHRSTLYTTTGRRPMQRYPNIWVTRSGLIAIRELYEGSGIPTKEFPRPFKKVATKLERWLADGKSPDRADAQSWLTGWAFRETLDELKKELDLKRSEKYLEATG